MAGETVAVRQRYFEEVGRYRLTMCFRKSAGTVRSRRYQSAKKGFGGGSHQQAKSGISAPAEIPDFPHLYIQMPSLPPHVREVAHPRRIPCCYIFVRWQRILTISVISVFSVEVLVVSCTK